MEGHRSEVAYFREQQALREEAAERGLTGFAAVASHESITARMERGAKRILRLAGEGRHEEAVALMNSDAWYTETEEGQQEGSEQMGQCHETLQHLVGEHEATRLLVEVLEGSEGEHGS